jgi:hypothetical protein
MVVELSEIRKTSAFVLICRVVSAKVTCDVARGEGNRGYVEEEGGNGEEYIYFTRQGESWSNIEYPS